MVCVMPLLDDPSKDRGPADPSGPEPPLPAEVKGASSLSALREVRRLDGLIRAHTLLGFMEPRTSRGHQENLLRAYVFVLRTWNVRTLVTLELSASGRIFSIFWSFFGFYSNLFALHFILRATVFLCLNRILNSTVVIQ